MTKAKRTERRIQEENCVIGQNVRSLRLGAQMSLGQLAELLEISYQQVQKYETGANRLPLQYIPLLCDVFGVPAEVFLNGLTRKLARQDSDIVQVQLRLAGVRDRHLRQKIVQVIDILAA